MFRAKSGSSYLSESVDGIEGLPGVPEPAFVPVVMAVVDQDHIRWCNAGHTPPILVSADGTRRELSGTGLPLGVDPDATYTTAEAPLVVGPHAAPVAASLLDLADELWGTGTAGLTPAG